MSDGNYEMRASDSENEVRWAGMAYLEAAETVYAAEIAKTGWMAIHNWFVVHHLSVIAAEILTKSLRVTYRKVEWSEEGPTNYDVEHAYNTHHFKAMNLHPDDWQDLQDHLTTEQLALLTSISERDKAMSEISRGRYPYSLTDGATFPADESGRLVAESWLNLARAIAKFKD